MVVYGQDYFLAGTSVQLRVQEASDEYEYFPKLLP